MSKSFYGARQFWTYCASSVINAFLELEGTNGHPSSGAFYRRLASEGAGAPMYKNEIRVTPSDFTSDTILAAKSALTPEEYQKFKRQVLSGRVALNAYDKDVRERLGRVFLARRLYPVSQYFSTAVSTETQKCSCGNKEHTLIKSSTAWCKTCPTNLLHHPVGLYWDYKVDGSVDLFCTKCADAQEQKLIEEARKKEAA